MAGEVTGADLGLVYGWDARDNTWRTGNEANLRKLDAVVMLAVLEIGTETPPGAPSLGDRYVLGATPTGAWAGQTGKLAVWRKADSAAAAAWEFHTPAAGWIAWDVATGSLRVYNGSTWTGVGATTGKVYTCTSSEAVNDLVYVSSADNVRRAQADALSTSRVVGWVAAKLTTTTCLVAQTGRPTASGLTAAATVFLSEATPGAATSTPPSGSGEVIVPVGVADAATSFLFSAPNPYGLEVVP